MFPTSTNSNLLPKSGCFSVLLFPVFRSSKFLNEILENEEKFLFLKEKFKLKCFEFDAL